MCICIRSNRMRIDFWPNAQRLLCPYTRSCVWKRSRVALLLDISKAKAQIIHIEDWRFFTIINYQKQKRYWHYYKSNKSFSIDMLLIYLNEWITQAKKFLLHWNTGNLSTSSTLFLRGILGLLNNKQIFLRIHIARGNNHHDHERTIFYAPIKNWQQKN